MPRLPHQALVRHLLLQGREGAAHLRVHTEGAAESVSPRSLGFPLMFEWHGQMYLGAVHGRFRRDCSSSQGKITTTVCYRGLFIMAVVHSPLTWGMSHSVIPTDGKNPLTASPPTRLAGLSGILYVLLSATAHVPASELHPGLLDDALAGARALLSCRLPSGNLPSSLGSTSDK